MFHLQQSGVPSCPRSIGHIDPLGIPWSLKKREAVQKGNSRRASASSGTMGRRSALALAVLSALLCQVGSRAGPQRGGGRGARLAVQLSLRK